MLRVASDLAGEPVKTGSDMLLCRIGSALAPGQFAINGCPH
jgi:hypothetical protein